MGFICREYNVIKSQIIIRNINKPLPLNVTKFDGIPDESKYYNTVRNENFMILKYPNLIFFQFPF